MIKLIANYSKRLGLPGYSSHQYSVSVETELMTTDDFEQESESLYHLLQENVDRQILETGFVPNSTYGMDQPDSSSASEATSDLEPTNITQWQSRSGWSCSEKQRDLILKIVDENQLNKKDIEALAVERFGTGVKRLNKLEASGLIDELLDLYGGKPKGGGNPRSKSAYSGGNRRRAA
ncbi:MAG: hypothetical protein ACSHYB_07925 [Roseibacillus sp.]